jgi:hypothetical protein
MPSKNQRRTSNSLDQMGCAASATYIGSVVLDHDGHKPIVNVGSVLLCGCTERHHIISQRFSNRAHEMGSILGHSRFTKN